MFTSKEKRFQMCDHIYRYRNYPASQFIYSAEQHEIVSLYNKSYENVFENATGSVIKLLIHPNLYNPYHNVMQLLQSTIKFNAKMYSSTTDRALMMFLGVYDIYLIPVVKLSSSESLLPTFKTVEKLWISEAQMIGSPTYFIEMFHLTLWLMFIAFFLAIGCLSAFAFNRLKKCSTAAPFDSFTWFSIITQQGADTRPKFTSQQLVLLSLSILTIMFYGSFEAFMSSYLAMRKPDLPFNDIRGLLKTKEYSICIPVFSRDVTRFVESELVANGMQVNRINNEHCPGIFKTLNLNFESTTSEGKINRHCPTKKTAIISANLFGLFDNKQGDCRIMLLPGNYFPNYIGLPLSQTFKYREHFNRGIIRQMSAGNTNYLHNRFQRQRNSDRMQTYIYDEEDKASITLHQTKIVFMILLCGMALSLLVLVVEKIIVIHMH